MTTYEIKPVEFTRPDNWQAICDSLANYEANLDAMSDIDRARLVRNNLGLHDSAVTTTFPFQA